ncbi:hypothetical protein QBC36DRAFT_300835 [Triangularia setosa]|uniref:Uncharacterized protein n=1 Tax=Triangularia setosa TaxID=2587417 RepID=A0AAN6W839_9PEZI|nr:hypothetical protein QBC36DRAFT_300835 [Podospora setosa]
MILPTYLLIIISIFTQIVQAQTSTMDSITQETHDTTAAGYHIADFPTFLSHLTDAVSAAWSDRLSTRYRKVKVLLMSWEQDDLGVDDEVKPLASVFRGLYHYDTEIWKIPTRRATVEFSKKVTNLVDTYGQEGNLLIFYYGGHARPNEQAGGSPVWVANRSRDTPTVPSSIIHSLLSDADCDVLLLHDACHAIQAGEPSTGKGVVETIAACGFESVAAEVGPHSFTSSLIQELAHAAHTTEWLSVVELHRRLINRLQAWMPSVCFTDTTYSVVQVDRHTGQPMFEKPRRRTPIYCFLSKKPRTIVLSPLPVPQPLSITEEPHVYLNTPTTKPKISPTGPGILLACRLRDQNLDVEKWKQWLLTAPPEAQSIQISAIYPSFSALLILELPLVVWDLLPPSPALSFIGYTTGKNHASEFQRILGLDSDDLSHESEEDSDDDTRVDQKSRAGKCKTFGPAASIKAPRRSGGRDRRSKEHGLPSLWPKIFSGDRTAVYAAENDQYCLNMAEQHPDKTLTMEERIVRVFAEDVGDPSMRYICDEIESFCAPASFEALVSGQDEYANVVALLDERPPPTSEGSGIGNKRALLTPTQLFNILSSMQTLPLLIQTEPKSNSISPRRRLLYLTNLDPASSLAVISTASRNQALFLKEFIYKHITFQSGLDVKLQSSGSPCFQIAFHLPFFAWRRQSKASTDARLGGDGRPLRSSKNVSFLFNPSDKSDEAYVHEVQMSCMIVGVDNRCWTAYGVFDTYHDGGESKHDVQVYESAEDEIPEDPLTGGRYASDRPIWTAREYFLRVLMCCISEAKEEWQNTGRNLLRALKPYTTNAKDADWRKIQRVSHQTVQLLEQLQQALYGTVSAWERFRENDLPYFDLDNGARAKSLPDGRVMVKNIEHDIRELRVLGETLARETAMLKSYTSALFTLDNNRNGEKTNALVTTGLSFLPFTLMALVSSAPDILVVQATPMRYAISSAVVACLTFAFFVAIFHFAAATDKAGGFFTYLRELQLPQLTDNNTRRQIDMARWQPKWWFSTKGQQFRQLQETESETNLVENSQRLPF